jgi:NADPH-dependent 2,4-dienoyl-CoA reductase/sulfur reductase-like enzyme
MTEFSRRDFGRLIGGGAFTAAAASPLGSFALAQAAPKVVIIGGGAGGASLANVLKKGDPQVDVTLVETNPVYSSSFFSNLYLGGIRDFASLNHGYADLRKTGVRVVIDTAIDVDAVKKAVKLKSGRTLAYDRLVLSPGIEINYSSIPGYTAELAGQFPHAYTTDGRQKMLLKGQLDKMPDGGVVVMAMPNNPFRCPPGPYERACMIAHVLKTKKPKSKLVILDPKKAFSKQAVFVEGINKHYKDIVELNLSNDIDDHSIASFDPKTRELTTKAGKKVKGDVVNLIPQQRAGQIAAKAGVTEGDWVPVNPENMLAKKGKDIYVIGDATVAAEMPKSAFSANSQAKVVAAELLAELSKKDRFPARYRNTCWSLIAPDDCIKIGSNYAPKDGKFDPSGGFVSQPGEDATVRKQNFVESVGWYDSIITDMFAKRKRSAASDTKAG